MIMRIPLLAALLTVTVPAIAAAQSIARGQYIVERVGLCHDCHTPRDEKGQLIIGQGLKGAPIGFRPLHPMPFATEAPALAGLPGHYTPEQMAVFLQTGKRPDGSAPLPPMPPYRLNREDALAVTAYLRTLK